MPTDGDSITALPPSLLHSYTRLWMVCVFTSTDTETHPGQTETYNELWEHVVDEVVLLTLAGVVFAWSSIHIVWVARQFGARRAVAVLGEKEWVELGRLDRVGHDVLQLARKLKRLCLFV